MASVLYTNLHQIFEVLSQHKISDVVLCPGSRSIPLAYTALSNKQFKCYPVLDERSAGFVALGLAQSSNKPVVIITTSGTAVLNLFPAIAEAHHSQTQLIVLTADRPDELHGIGENQTIQQQSVYRGFVKASYHLHHSTLLNDDNAYLIRILNEAVLLSQNGEKGVVHINFAFKEPFYPPKDFTPKLTFQTKFWSSITPIKNSIEAQLLNIYAKSVLVLVGSNYYLSPETKDLLIKAQIELNWVVYCDVVSSFHNPVSLWSGSFIEENQVDLIAPDVLITLEGQINTKGLKLFLKKNPPKTHIHISQSPLPKDTYGCLTHHIQATNQEGLEILIQEIGIVDFKWKYSFDAIGNELNSTDFDTLFKDVKSESTIFHDIWIKLPYEGYVYHVSNSLPIRYLAEFPYSIVGKEIHCNRGTSGIDGSISTSIGYALSNTSQKHIVLTGDGSMLYDSNSLQSVKLLDNPIKILIINNKGGKIFGYIDGNDAINKDIKDTYFNTYSVDSFKGLALMYELDYYVLNAGSDYNLVLTLWLENNKSSILELVIDDESYHQLSFKEIKKQMIRNL